MVKWSSLASDIYPLFRRHFLITDTSNKRTHATTCNSLFWQQILFYFQAPTFLVRWSWITSFNQLGSTPENRLFSRPGLEAGTRSVQQYQWCPTTAPGTTNAPWPSFKCFTKNHIYWHSKFYLTSIFLEIYFFVGPETNVNQNPPTYCTILSVLMHNIFYIQCFVIEI